jgi:hypothetical protein
MKTRPIDSPEVSLLLAWDADAGVWYLSDSSMRGLSGEAPSLPRLLNKLAERIPELEDLPTS